MYKLVIIILFAFTLCSANTFAADNSTTISHANNYVTANSKATVIFNNSKTILQLIFNGLKFKQAIDIDKLEQCYQEAVAARNELSVLTNGSRIVVSFDKLIVIVRNLIDETKSGVIGKVFNGKILPNVAPEKIVKVLNFMNLLQLANKGYATVSGMFNGDVLAAGDGLVGFLEGGLTILEPRIGISLTAFDLVYDNYILPKVFGPSDDFLEYSQSVMIYLRDINLAFIIDANTILKDDSQYTFKTKKALLIELSSKYFISATNERAKLENVYNKLSWKTTAVNVNYQTVQEAYGSISDTTNHVSNEINKLSTESNIVSYQSVDLSDPDLIAKTGNVPANQGNNSDEPKISDFKSSLNEIFAGTEAVSFSATTISEAGAVDITASLNGIKERDIDLASANKKIWNSEVTSFLKPGKYTLIASVKDISGKVVADGNSAPITLTVKPAAYVSGVRSSVDSVVLGGKVEFTASVRGTVSKSARVVLKLDSYEVDMEPSGNVWKKTVDITNMAESGKRTFTAYVIENGVASAAPSAQSLGISSPVTVNSVEAKMYGQPISSCALNENVDFFAKVSGPELPDRVVLKLDSYEKEMMQSERGLWFVRIPIDQTNGGIRQYSAYAEKSGLRSASSPLKDLNVKLSNATLTVEAQDINGNLVDSVNLNDHVHFVVNVSGEANGKIRVVIGDWLVPQPLVRQGATNKWKTADSVPMQQAENKAFYAYLDVNGNTAAKSAPANQLTVVRSVGLQCPSVARTGDWINAEMLVDNTTTSIKNNQYTKWVAQGCSGKTEELDLPFDKAGVGWTWAGHRVSASECGTYVYMVQTKTGTSLKDYTCTTRVNMDSPVVANSPSTQNGNDPAGSIVVPNDKKNDVKRTDIPLVLDVECQDSKCIPAKVRATDGSGNSTYEQITELNLSTYDGQVRPMTKDGASWITDVYQVRSSDPSNKANGFSFKVTSNSIKVQHKDSNGTNTNHEYFTFVGDGTNNVSTVNMPLFFDPECQDSKCALVKIRAYTYEINTAFVEKGVSDQITTMNFTTSGGQVQLMRKEGASWFADINITNPFTFKASSNLAHVKNVRKNGNWYNVEHIYSSYVGEENTIKDHCGDLEAGNGLAWSSTVTLTTRENRLNALLSGHKQQLEFFRGTDYESMAQKNYDHIAAAVQRISSTHNNLRLLCNGNEKVYMAASRRAASEIIGVDEKLPFDLPTVSLIDMDATSQGSQGYLVQATTNIAAPKELYLELTRQSDGRVVKVHMPGPGPKWSIVLNGDTKPHLEGEYAFSVCIPAGSAVGGGQCMFKNNTKLVFKGNNDAIKNMYSEFAAAYNAKNDAKVLSFISDDWESQADSTTIADLATNMRNSFRVFNTVNCGISNLQITHDGFKKYKVHYDILIRGQIFKGNIRHEEKSSVDEYVVMDDRGQPKISKTLSGRFWYVQ